MLKKFSVILAGLFLVSCTSNDVRICPRVFIPRETAYVTQKVNFSEEFQVEVVGYEGYCYLDDAVNRYKTVITPIFEVKRLSPSQETDVQFSYFTETIKGPPAYLGRNNYAAGTTLALGELTKQFKGRPITLKIPHPDDQDFTVLMGINMCPDEQSYNKRTFDINYKYIDNNGFHPLTPAYPERNPEVKPEPAPKGCGSCHL